MSQPLDRLFGLQAKRFAALIGQQGRDVMRDLEDVYADLGEEIGVDLAAALTRAERGALGLSLMDAEGTVTHFLRVLHIAKEARADQRQQGIAADRFKSNRYCANCLSRTQSLSPMLATFVVGQATVLNGSVLTRKFGSGSS